MARASLRQLYRVGSEIPSSFAISGTVLLCGGSIFFRTASLRSAGYHIVDLDSVPSLAYYRQIFSSVNYPDGGGCQARSIRSTSRRIMRKSTVAFRPDSQWNGKKKGSKLAPLFKTEKRIKEKQEIKSLISPIFTENWRKFPRYVTIQGTSSLLTTIRYSTILSIDHRVKSNSVAFMASNNPVFGAKLRISNRADGPSDGLQRLEPKSTCT